MERVLRSNTTRIALGVAAVVLAVVLFVLLKDDGGDNDTSGSGSSGAKTVAGTRAKPAKPQVPVIAIGGGKPVGGVAELSYSAGERIRFKVRSDVADEIHVHGYDLTKDVEAGGTVGFDFAATIEGVFEAELEDRGEQILELRVNP
ncbi:MAG TPA: hypothetical protein VNM89_01695 [Solirubrobacterales bacterium]|nr:hypothetical protein [Solirubrobacterales bacterium]